MPPLLFPSFSPLSFIFLKTPKHPSQCSLLLLDFKKLREYIFFLESHQLCIKQKSSPAFDNTVKLWCEEKNKRSLHWVPGRLKGLESQAGPVQRRKSALGPFLPLSPLPTSTLYIPVLLLTPVFSFSTSTPLLLTKTRTVPKSSGETKCPGQCAICFLPGSKKTRQDIFVPHHSKVKVTYLHFSFHTGRRLQAPVSTSPLFCLRHLISPVSLCDSVLSGFSLLLIDRPQGRALHLQPLMMEAAVLAFGTLSRDQWCKSATFP